MQVDESGSVFRYLLPFANDVQQINRGESHLFFFFSLIKDLDLSLRGMTLTW